MFKKKKIDNCLLWEWECVKKIGIRCRKKIKWQLFVTRKRLHIKFIEKIKYIIKKGIYWWIKWGYNRKKMCKNTHR